MGRILLRLLQEIHVRIECGICSMIPYGRGLLIWREASISHDVVVGNLVSTRSANMLPAQPGQIEKNTTIQTEKDEDEDRWHLTMYLHTASPEPLDSLSEVHSRSRDSYAAE